MNSPRLYATFLLWMLSELFEQLPEVGDLDKPKLVFFFDEAHLLFDEAPKALLERIELVVRLVRSKGVGVYFVTQNPLDIPDTRAGPARQPRPARAARLHAARPEGGEGGGEHDARQSEARHRDRDHRARGRRGAGQPARREGPAERDRARLRAAAGQPDRPDQRRRAQGADRRLAGRRRLREGGRPRVGVREAEGPGRGAAPARRRQRRRRRTAGDARRHAPPRPRRRRRRPARRPEGRALRHHRPARRPARGPGRSGGALGRAHDRLERRPRDHPRRARLDPRRRRSGADAAQRRLRCRRTTRSLRLPSSRPCRRGSWRSRRRARSRARTWPACSRAGARPGSAAARRC